MHNHIGRSKQAIRVSSAIAAAITSAVIISACSSDSVVGGTTQAQLAFTTTGSAAVANLSPATATTPTAGATLSDVKLIVDRAELKRAHTDACEGDHDEDGGESSASTTPAPSTDNCAEVKIGPTTIDLPLTPGLVTIPANTIPVGTFREFELSVSKVELTGTFVDATGTSSQFDVTLPVRVRQEVEFATPLVVTDGVPAAVTVTVDVSHWLVNPDGTAVDPSEIANDPVLMAAVVARIRASFHAFEDRNHDGKDDHGGN
ncbi:MAG TPA: hypothetical protein VII52_10895 [Gemmatimonadaceae bacterium]